MSAHSEDNRSAQEEELLVLRSMYDESMLTVNDGQKVPGGRISASVNLPKPFVVTCQRFSDSAKNTDMVIDHLPSIELIFEFPDSYPTLSRPIYTLSCSWLTLSQLVQLCVKLESMWRENGGEVILFNWVIFLQEDSLSHLGIGDSLDLTELSQSKINPSRVVRDIKSSPCSEPLPLDASDSSNSRPTRCEPSDHEDSNVPSGLSVIDIIRDYNNLKKREAFNSTWQTCDICASEKQGFDFAILPVCGHHFCKECLKSYYEMKIVDGNVKSLKCPDSTCESDADLTLVKQLIEARLFQRYDSLLLARTLENMSDVAYCPRKGCETPCLLEVERRLGQCLRCGFTFCIYCCMTYHGIAPCSVKSSERIQLCKKYVNSSPEEKILLENRYGKKFLKTYVDNFLSDEWVSSNSKSCPHCQVKIEKNDGCNKMTCYKCNCFFCWICMAKLEAGNPYSHYWNHNSTCYNQLFPAAFLDDDYYPGEFLELN